MQSDEECQELDSDIVSRVQQLITKKTKLHSKSTVDCWLTDRSRGYLQRCETGALDVCRFGDYGRTRWATR